MAGCNKQYWPLASICHSRVTFIFANLAAQQIYRWIKKTVERVYYYKFKWQHQQDRRKLGKPYLFHPRWRIFVYKLNVGSSAITRPGLCCAYLVNMLK